MAVWALALAPEPVNSRPHLHALGRSRVRLIRQGEIAECGLASLAMVANYYGLNIDLGTLRRQHAPSMRGALLKTLIDTADQIGLTSRALKLPVEGLGTLRTPAILHWNMNHYVVLERVRGRRALVHDPAGGSRWLGEAEISKSFTGVALELTPGMNFESTSRRETLRLSSLWQRMQGLKRAVVQTILLSLLMQAYVLAAPYYLQLAVDVALPALDQDLLTVIGVGFFLFSIINAGIGLLRSYVLLWAGSTLSFGIAVNVARRLFRLPVVWFERRQVGDVLSRFQSIGPIQKVLTEGAVAALLDGALAVITLILMFYYSPMLATIAVVALALYLVLRYFTFGAQKDAQEEEIVAHAREQSMMIETLRGIVTLRLFNREATRHASWQARLAEAINGRVRLAKVNVWQEGGSVLILGVENGLSIWLAVSLVMQGGFTVGMVFAYLLYKTQFMAKAASLVDQWIAFRMLGLHLERISDIAMSEEDGSFAPGQDREVPLNGRVELRDVSFRYSPSDPLVLNGINLSVEPGEHVAITGPSGGGKSTLVKILLGLIEPTAGELLVDGLPLRQLGYRNYREQIAAVLQDDSLFSGSIANNIALFDEVVDAERIAVAATAAAIHDDIVAMPMGFETLVGDMGSSLSGGQKQRVLLARALYRAPKLLIIDEGTAHLDAATEKVVNNAIAKMGITRIIIAHRSETILSADRIVSLSREGGIVPVPRVSAVGTPPDAL